MIHCGGAEARENNVECQSIIIFLLYATVIRHQMFGNDGIAPFSGQGESKVGRSDAPGSVRVYKTVPCVSFSISFSIELTESNYNHENYNEIFGKNQSLSLRLD